MVAKMEMFFIYKLILFFLYEQYKQNLCGRYNFLVSVIWKKTI